MLNRRIVRRISLCLVMGLIILGCASPAFVTPPPSTPLSSSIETIIVHTAVAAQTQTAIVLPPTETLTASPFPTKTVTITPTPTPTIVFLFLTKTSSPEDLLADDEGNGTGGSGGNGYVKPTATPSEWACRVISRSPAHDTVIPRGTTFRAIWTVENTGTKTWPKKGVDVVYHSGADLRIGKPYIDIPTTVGPGGRITITVTLKAPNYPKVYSTRWGLRVGRTDFCGVKFVIEVK